MKKIAYSPQCIYCYMHRHGRGGCILVSSIEDLGNSPTLTCQSGMSGSVCAIREACTAENTGNPRSVLAGTHALCLWSLDWSQWPKTMTKSLVPLLHLHSWILVVPAHCLR